MNFYDPKPVTLNDYKFSDNVKRRIYLNHNLENPCWFYNEHERKVMKARIAEYPINALTMQDQDYALVDWMDSNTVNYIKIKHLVMNYDEVDKQENDQQQETKNFITMNTSPTDVKEIIHLEENLETQQKEPTVFHNADVTKIIVETVLDDDEGCSIADISISSMELDEKNEQEKKKKVNEDDESERCCRVTVNCADCNNINHDYHQ